MTAIPTELVESASRLEEAGIERIRAQATISAEICRSTQSSRTVRLIEEQYTDFDRLRNHSAEGSMETLLAAILHVADAFDAVTHPRPYQERVPRYERIRTLTDDRGIRFRPGLVEILFQLEWQKATVTLSPN